MRETSLELIAVSAQVPDLQPRFAKLTAILKSPVKFRHATLLEPLLRHCAQAVGAKGSMTLFLCPEQLGAILKDAITTHAAGDPVFAFRNGHGDELRDSLAAHFQFFAKEWIFVTN